MGLISAPEGLLNCPTLSVRKGGWVREGTGRGRLAVTILVLIKLVWNELPVFHHTPFKKNRNKWSVRGLRKGSFFFPGREKKKGGL